jgi:hypothetical protein
MDFERVHLNQDADACRQRRADRVVVTRWADLGTENSEEQQLSSGRIPPKSMADLLQILSTLVTMSIDREGAETRERVHLNQDADACRQRRADRVVVTRWADLGTETFRRW